SAIGEILIREHIVGTGLHIQARGYAVSHVGQERPVLHVENAAANLKPVGVGIDEAGHDGLALNVEHPSSGRNAAAFSDALDAVVFNHDVGVGDHFRVLQGDDGCATQDDGALGSGARHFERNVDFLNILGTLV